MWWEVLLGEVAMENKRRKPPLKKRACPSCGEVGGLKRILYGMPDEDFKYDKYIVGGCIVTGSDPQIGCIHCGWEGEPKSDLFNLN
jgi:hypothetical protein